MTTRERNLYERSLKQYRDLLADKETTKNRIKAARIEGTVLIAKNLKAMGLSVSQIMQATGLSQEEIKKL